MDLIKLVLSFLANLSALSSSWHQGNQRSCVASVFGTADDRHAGGEARCIGRKVDPEGDVGVAHRTLPCGSRVIVSLPRTGKTAVATVIDRGPYGAMHEGEWVLKRKKDDPGEWRGCLDMTPRLSEFLGHNGFEKVRYAPVVERKHATPTR